MSKVILVNPFEVPRDAGEGFLSNWSRAAEYMQRQSGFVSTRLHQALSPEARFGFINLAEWESPSHFQAAVTSAEFVEMSRNAPPSNPALYEVVRTLEGKLS